MNAKPMEIDNCWWVSIRQYNRAKESASDPYEPLVWQRFEVRDCNDRLYEVERLPEKVVFTLFEAH
jgi:hypothetical protein